MSPVKRCIGGDRRAIQKRSDFMVICMPIQPSHRAARNVLRWDHGAAIDANPMHQSSLLIKPRKFVQVVVVGVAPAMLLEHTRTVQSERRFQRGCSGESKRPNMQMNRNGLDEHPLSRDVHGPGVRSRPRCLWNEYLHPQRLRLALAQGEGKRVAFLVRVPVNARNQRIGPKAGRPVFQRRLRDVQELLEINRNVLPRDLAARSVLQIARIRVNARLVAPLRAQCDLKRLKLVARGVEFRGLDRLRRGSRIRPNLLKWIYNRRCYGLLHRARRSGEARKSKSGSEESYHYATCGAPAARAEVACAALARPDPIFAM